MASHIFNPPTPYVGPIFGGFVPGAMVRVQGRMNPTGQSLTVNLEAPRSKENDIAIHVNPRLQTGEVVRNSKITGKWGKEENDGPALPIRRGEAFEIVLLSDKNETRIGINGQSFGTFPHRLTSLNEVNQVRVSGDITISMVQVVVDPQANTHGLLFPGSHLGYPIP